MTSREDAMKPSLGIHRKFGGELYLRVAYHFDKRRVDVVARKEKSEGDHIRVFKHKGLWYLYRRLTVTTGGVTHPVSRKGTGLSRLFYYGGKK